MNLSQNPELLEKLASAYALGTLRGGARRRFETLAREQAPVRAAALIWQSRVASMNELQAPSEPAPAVWTRIDNLVRADKEQAEMTAARESRIQAAPGGWLRSLALWRGTTAAGALATVLAVVTAVGLRDNMGAQIGELQAKLATAPQVEYVAVLNDDQSSASMLVTFDPNNKKLTLQRVGDFKEAADKSLQLWALPPSGGPRSLGVLSQERLLKLAAAEGDVREVPTLAISLEPKGGVPSETGPTGPVLFKGALIQKML
ncbi:RNA polymerase subunit sigma-70 [Hydrogenophaga crassostreae]|uniref:RNA polymerase subunit sigma-70 n=1 Tax=Hydrogenophaga crassostreae TaxID=1763535 RepID=A0A167IPZ2_9BURK|nr:anti-sigma factor [Hydrogenophaga crassostreae]AOW14584.1 RNA polymerase subunit sigma-70 [Hydrogenophaga crassostreae]OAD43318.1 RNA polymerase subunit sigma-70 [Hydrogenophaga crassostreae]